MLWALLFDGYVESEYEASRTKRKTWFSKEESETVTVKYREPFYKWKSVELIETFPTPKDVSTWRWPYKAEGSLTMSVITDGEDVYEIPTTILKSVPDGSSWDYGWPYMENIYDDG